MKLYKVTLTYELVALGETERDAIWNAEQGARQSEPDGLAVDAIVSAADLPAEWRYALPWGSNGDWTDKECAAWIDAAKEGK